MWNRCAIAGMETYQPGITSYGAMLSGIPSASRETPYQLSVRVEDALGQLFFQDYSVFVRPVLESLRLITEQLPILIMGEEVSFRIAASGGEGKYRWQVGADSLRLPAGLVLGCDSEHEICALTGTATETGEFLLSVSVADKVSSLPVKQFSGRVIELPTPPPPLTICDDNLPSAVFSVPYFHRLCALGGYPPYRWQLTWNESGSPDWLNVDLTTGILTGTPNRSEEHPFSANVSDNQSGTVTRRNLLLMVNPPSQRGPLLLIPESLPPAVVSREYEATISILNARGHVRWQVESNDQPAWLDLEYKDRYIRLHGLPSEPGFWSLRIRAVDSERAEGNGSIFGSVGPINVSITAIEEKLAPEPVNILTEVLPTAIVGQPYHVRIAANGGEGRLSFTVVSNNGKWISVDADGVISGTPTVEGENELSIKAQDAGGRESDVRTLKLNAMALPNEN